jgi:hypothetical protein
MDQGVATIRERIGQIGRLLFAMSVVWMSQIIAPAPAQAQSISAAEAEAIAQEAYIFLYPLSQSSSQRCSRQNARCVPSRRVQESRRRSPGSLWPEQVIKSVLAKAQKHGKGIVLMHDFQHQTAEALPELLNQLKAHGYKIVHMKAKDPLRRSRSMTSCSRRRSSCRPSATARRHRWCAR